MGVVRLRFLLALALLAGFFFYSWRGLGDLFRERGRYTDALGLIPAATPPLRFGVPCLQELAVRYHLEPKQATCALCHLGAVHGGNFNPFGQDYQAAAQRILTGMEGTERKSIFQLSPAQVRQALAEATRDGLDSDGDGYDNDLELLFGFHPGDAASRPTRPPEVLLAYRERLRQAARSSRLESLLRQGTGGPVELGLWGHPEGAIPLVRLERLALYQAALEAP
ncbi:hypothetical protein Mlute_02122 [Meiothermus luteus]|jgi:hypothetical protein|uniref:Uncharacterized protein n=1 Tax=Meiothermus luteus TaxID=2026184 RepID=A0A399EMK5_9DEIN|nr:hypothetical protein Mlute_02122 [Meiothermus luteus]RMH56323.1 MAG: hypothetical protein D6684_05610 [Deinococcota bacterium]